MCALTERVCVFVCVSMSMCVSTCAYCVSQYIYHYYKVTVNLIDVDVPFFHYRQTCCIMTSVYKMNSGTLLSSRLLSLLKNGQWERDDVVKLFIALVKQFDDRKEDFDTWIMKILYKVEIYKIKASDFTYPNGDQFVDHVDAKIKDIIENNDARTLDEIICEICEQTNIDKQVMAEVKDIVSFVSERLSCSTLTHLKEIKKKLFTLCEAVQKTKKMIPRLTQMVSWCLLVLSKSSHLVQVGTGKGKSCIVAMFAAYQALEGKTPDVISSSPVLAEKDAKEWSGFYKELKITVDVNTNKSKDKDLKKCYECQVVYGTTESFAGDYLRQCFHRLDVRPEREFHCVIVDEVDSLMLDKGLEVVFLNTEVPLMEQLNGILAEIWHTVSQLKRLDTGEILGPIQQFSKILIESFPESDKIDHLSLHDLIDGKLQTWIENALKATKIVLGHEYILHGDGVVPVDYMCTGVVQNNMVWGDGLQQFLEMKHQTKLSNMSLITNFMSNVGLFKRYNNHIFGITGTLGDQTELDMLKKLYDGIETCQIPSFKRRKLYELEGLKVCKAVKEQVSSTVYRGPRAALVICETINRAMVLHSALVDTTFNGKLKLYVNNNMDNSTIVDRTVQEGDVIIATNLAGRGTDLKVCESVNKAGGLFVQAFGRTGRQGSPGSAQLIMCCSHFSESVKLIMGLNTSFNSLFSCLDGLATILCCRDVIVSSLHECWGLWLMMNFSEEKSIDTLKQQLMVDMLNAMEKLLSEQTPSSMVYYYIRSGNKLRQNGHLAESMEMYTKAVEDEQNFSKSGLPSGTVPREDSIRTCLHFVFQVHLLYV
ncbi:hypothetical protein IRJ41_008448 [Triplophysa rosa]|uniref:Uncharacterized protein n=1 Tax=Triplophysa rosa TaxID=992332 RepID=A0A9W7TRA4_TRIRA|nr:hypothetical protein IRJ41_008448 [Triplophysa rosa]